MSATKKSSLIMLCFSLAVACLLGVFAIMDASSANASQGEVSPPATVLQTSIIISPTELQATLHPNELLTQTLWITNTGDSDLTFTIYEMTTSVRLASAAKQVALAGFTLDPISVPVVDPAVQAQISAQGSTLAIIFLREKPDLSPAYQIPDKDARRLYVYNRLLVAASHSQELFQWLESQGTQPHRLLTANAIAATLNASQLSWLADNPQVRQIIPNHQNSIIASSPTPLEEPQLPTVPSLKPDMVEWNIAKIRADEAWSTFGITGTGAVVGIIDTGVMYNHTGLVNTYRGNLEGNFDHNFNWFDFVSGNPAPYDDNGHGTMITGIVSGDGGAGNQIGVAPGADWIAAKACNSGGMCTDEALHAALQWMLAPTDLSGANADPSKAPQVVFGGWGTAGCNGTFEFDISILRAAGILPIFASGGGGPTCNSLGSPADLPDVLTAGATDADDLISSFSPRGPSCYDEIKPDVTAPGVNVRSSFNDGGYQIWSGTAESSAHAAGVAALIISADPMLGADAVENILYTSALCIQNLTCGGDACPDANNVYGHGRIDAYMAVYTALGNPPQAELPWLSEAPMSATLTAGQGVTIDITYDASGLEPGIYSGALGILISEPNQPFSSVPVTLEVANLPAPVIVIDPLSFSATLPIGGVQTDTLMISNQGDAALTFNLSEISSIRRLTTSPVQIPIQDPFPTSVPAQVDAGVKTQLLIWGQSRLIIYLRGQPDFSAAYNIRGRSARVQYVYDQLLKLATQSNDLYDWLLSQGTQPRRLLTANAIAATLNAAQLEKALSFPQVGRVGINGQAEILQDGPATLNWLQTQYDNPNSVEWNIAKIGADQVWSTFGIRGQGAVVGVVDTGVMFTHPALNTQYRGNLGGGSYDHNYNWYDLVYSQTVPYDDNNHGTFGMGIVLGDDGGNNQIGVAPGAQWIAVKALDTYGGGSFETLHAALQWMLAPTDLNGDNPDPFKAPQVVLNMWGISSYYCDHTFDTDLVALRAANILPVFAPGAEGPGCGTVKSPAADPNALSAGATDNNDVIAAFSANGPASCYNNGIKPDVVAPGIDIRSSIADGGYQGGWSGTSFSTAHLAGAAALLFSADPSISLDQLEHTLFDTAVCHDDQTCSIGASCPDPNNTYGYGRIDVFEAVSTIMGTSYDIPWLDETPISGTLDQGASLSITVTFDALGMQPGIYLGGIAIESNDPQAPLTTLPVSLTVTPPCQPANVLSVGITPSHPKVGELITFTAVATGTLPINYTWDFDDGSSSTGPVVTHFYDHAGIYWVGLTAENACGTYPVEIDVIVEVVPKWIFLPLVGK